MIPRAASFDAVCAGPRESRESREKADRLQDTVPRWFMALAVAGMLATAPGGLLLAQENAPSGAESSASAPKSGLRAYLDPTTGRLVSEPPVVEGGGAISMPVDHLEQFSTSHQGLVSETTLDGGLMLDLRGRFRQGTVATIGENRQLHVHRIGGEMFLSEEGDRVRREMHPVADSDAAEVGDD